MTKEPKLKYYVVLYNKITGDFIRKYPVKSEYLAERHRGYYNDMTINLKAKIEVEKEQ